MDRSPIPPVRFNSPPPGNIVASPKVAPHSEPLRSRVRAPAPPLRTNGLAGGRSGNIVPVDHAHNVMRNPGYYLKLPSGYRVTIGNELVEPSIYQPTPEGMQVLVDDFVSRTGCTLLLHDQSTPACGNLGIDERFKMVKPTLDAIHLDDGHCRVGIVLSNGQRHAIPVLLARHGVTKYLFIFDSNSGGAMRQYYQVANAFPEYQILLNAGTRQADSQSCITDAYEVLCAALQMPALCESILAKIDPDALNGRSEEHESNNRARRPRLFGPVLDGDNFHVFGMPEELCFTAQRTEFITRSSGADLGKRIVIHGRSTTLEHELIRHKEISLRPPGSSLPDGSPRSRCVGLNSYLYRASRLHKQLIDQILAMQGSSNSAHENVTTAKPAAEAGADLL